MRRPKGGGEGRGRVPEETKARVRTPHEAGVGEEETGARVRTLCEAGGEEEESGDVPPPQALHVRQKEMSPFWERGRVGGHSSVGWCRGDRE